MFQNIYPIFEKKRLLKKEMLENLRDYPRTFFDIQYQNYSDGILAGCDIKGTETGLVSLPGLLRYKGVFYFLNEPYPVPCKAEGKLTYLKVHFLDRAVGIGQEEYLSRIYVDERIPDSHCELELGRFKLQSGARLRTEYVDYYDYATEFDTMDRIHVPYAAPGKHGIWPQILKCFSRMLTDLSVQNPWDCAFCINCLQLKEAMPYEAVRTYLNMRLGQVREYTNEEIYGALRRILRETGGKAEHSGQPERKEKKLLML